MKKPKNLELIVRDITSRDKRYSYDAYQFILEALEHTYKMAGKKRHVSGQELLEGARRYALERYGPMARTVLEHWGVSGCEDIGEVVFNMVESGLLAKTDKDSKDDFKGGYDFKKVFDGGL